MVLFTGPLYFLVYGLLTVAALIVPWRLTRKAAGQFGMNVSGAGAMAVATLVSAALAIPIFALIVAFLAEALLIVTMILMATAAFYLPWWLTLKAAEWIGVNSDSFGAHFAAIIVAFILVIPLFSVMVFGVLSLIHALSNPGVVSILILTLIGGFIFWRVRRRWSAEITRFSPHQNPVSLMHPNRGFAPNPTRGTAP